ncbi:ABC transporter permease [Curtobacterium ammoniigenes]|uniref:ABC transporter permease n=1 Tax=Curtobacterium ammoniigenes TaxID=395387 RepID=UPI00082E4C3C|nr:ABC transporter permease [Curtobacterium ammoniigenes]
MNWVLSNLGTIWSDTLAHLVVALPPIVVSFVLSVPIGWLVVRLRRANSESAAVRGVSRGAGGVIITVSSLLYAIPSLPLFIALPSLIGTNIQDPINIVIALTLYGLALMVRSTADALESVDASILDAASAIGYSPAQRFFRVELPLAGPVLLAGIRVVAVSTISLTTVGAVLGVISLGSLFTDGIQRGIPEEILSGIVMVLILAFVIDAVLVGLARLILPWLHRTATPSGRKRAAAPRESTVAS